MKKFIRITSKFGGIIASLALFLGATSANSVCIWWYHQPKVPKGLKNRK